MGDVGKVRCIPIWICRTGDVTEPVVEEEIVLCEGAVDGYHVLGKVLDDLGGAGEVVCPPGDFVFDDESEHAFL